MPPFKVVASPWPSSWWRRKHASAPRAEERPASGSDDTAGTGEAPRAAISWRLVRSLLVRLAPERRSYAVVCLAGLVVAALEMIPPRLVGKVVDGMAQGSARLETILATVAVWAGVVLVMQVLHALQIGQANRAGERVLAQLRRDLFAHLQRLPVGFFDKTHPGKIIARPSTDLDSLRNIVVWGLNTLAANGALMVFSAIMLARIDVELFLAVAWLLPAMLVLSFLYANRVGRAWQNVLRHSAKVGAVQTENIAGARVVAAFNRQSLNLASYRDLNQINTVNNVRASRLGGFFQGTLQIVRFAGQALILLYGGYRVAVGTLPPGDLVAASLYWEWLMNPAITYGAFFNDLMIAMASGERIFSLLELEPAADGSCLPPAPADGSLRLRGKVRFESVRFSYRPGRQVLHGIDFEVPAGATVAMVGATGSGKSTIISLLTRFYQPESGRILLDGLDLASLPKAALHPQIALVSQSNFLFSGSVLENLRYSRPEASDAEIIAAAREIGCHDRILKLENGYDTAVGERGANLSLGERQLLCFTRAFVADPSILLLDEATSAVDPATEHQIQEATARLTRGRTTFIVAHRLTTVVKADLILVLDHGRIVEQGTHAALLQKSGKYAELVHHYHQDSARLIS
jgi:ABC-type multidrug transport system fused ATPase/permease subunit